MNFPKTFSKGIRRRYQLVSIGFSCQHGPQHQGIEAVSWSMPTSLTAFDWVWDETFLVELSVVIKLSIEISKQCICSNDWLLVKKSVVLKLVCWLSMSLRFSFSMRAIFVFYRPFLFFEISFRNAQCLVPPYRESAMVMAVVGPCMMNANGLVSSSACFGTKRRSA